ncbi:protein phosphatase 1 regulatory subunit 16A-like isoform X2 [Ruditapes philippinarum]|uniref:protein phosphatase 1 regulatory subunit 16A-like isoform X2 n=1 Tax=Ruditapes philippinarum TaxID=129788 RepID=UPI00295B44F8|nr:protein phosphatase 1 regulatory subunit 16A-like isoform X2 [Ruditapes philippinarum]
MSEHSDLVAEISNVEKMTTPERLKHAKKRRSQQLKRFANYEKQLEKDKNKKNKQSQNQKRTRKRARVKFIHNIMLLEASARNDVEEVRKLLMAGVSPDVTNEDGLTALHQCCIDDSEDMLKLLLEFGANVNARDSEMWTPLHAAATCGHVHLCKLLIDKGAELLAVNADGNMPYDICEDEVCLDFIETEMAKRGVTQEEIDDKRLETERLMLADLKKLAADKGNLEYRDKNWATPLHVAAANGYLDVVEFLINQRVSMEVRDEDGWLPIHAAACWLQPEVIEILVKSGADIDAKTRTGETPFDLAEDPDVKQKILDLKDELETHKASRSKDHVRNRRVNTRGLYSSTGSLYSSNGSLNEKPSSHGHSASIRRTSMRGEKRPLFKKEAKEEALHPFGQSLGDDDEIGDYMDDNKENLPATNIDDVKISIIEDEPDKHRHEAKERHEHTERHKNDKHDNVKTSKTVPPNSREPVRNSQKVKENISNEQIAQTAARGESQRNKSAESETRNSRAPEPIHVHMGRAESGPKGGSHSPQESSRSREPRPQSSNNDETRPQVTSNQPVAPNPQVKHIQGSSGISRTPSFQKKRESQRRRSQDLLNTSIEQTEESDQARYPTGTGTGTLADLKKQRSEQHKFGNGLDAQVQSLFLHSLAGDGKKYSSSSATTPPQQVHKESTQNGKNVKNNNNNTTGQSRPPTFISDSGPLRRFSAPSSAPVIGEDDKFKNDCCVIL